ncbi:MAG: VWA domain-containing protein [Candidatus Aminicenantes bacterium]|nr:VWA domain-containing protein [Candidatus Aminicenantes bacterium]NIM80612.1 VWA domain-containing protein [Candidatus Aminicenantes bacterium]NIN19993.1 VWA domain-containing protein [Candidatus Aminicenantes bacterium]NIN47971.1 VWA domain-containing protein [Candidatus Aminicenantes bacterium]NIN89317.1 VWA domain-containing protein [Candidatus Aminicenantes bacterium]
MKITGKIINVSMVMMLFTTCYFSFTYGSEKTNTSTQKQQKPEVIILSPREGEMWTGKQLIKVQLKGIDLRQVWEVGIYLDGRLLKEFSSPTPTITMSHHFGVKGQNRTLKVIVRGKKFNKLALAERKSLRVDVSHDVEVNQVMVPVVVKDKQGNYVRGLKKEDFVLLVDGKPKKISYLSTKGTVQFNMAQVIDISFSMRSKIYDVLLTSRDFTKKLLTGNDRGTFVFFNHKVFDHIGFTSDMKELDDRLNLQSPVIGGTALYDAIAYTLNEMNKISGWNIMVIFSDGEDNSSYIDRFSLVKKVKKSPVVIYAIDNKTGRPNDLLKQICDLSGGLTFTLTSHRRINKVYENIREEIMAQYVLFFKPDRRGKRKTSARFHTLTVKVKKRKYDIRTIKGFY